MRRSCQRGDADGSSPALRRSASGLLAAAVAVAGFSAAHAFGPYRKGDLPEARQGPHGALAMAAQEKQLDELLGGADPTAPPAEVDAQMWALFVPGDNEMTGERVGLGRKLYFDQRLSADNTVSCATCHDVSRGFTDQRPTSEGIRDQLGRRNAPTTMNAFFYDTLFLDGRVASLEEQAQFPPTNPVEGGHPGRDQVIASIAADADYQKAFRAAYGRDPNYEDMVRAIAAFERTLVFLRSPLDRFLGGDDKAVSAAAKRGWDLFNGKARCVSCHMINSSNPLGTDNRFHNIGVAARAQNFETLATKALAALEAEGGPEAVDQLALQTDLSELGRFLVTKDRADIGAFKTQGIRNVGVTAPYMHDGSMRTLWDVMDHYNKGGEANPFLDGGIEPLALEEKEIDDVVELMFSMTDERFADENRRELDAQRKLAASRRPFRDRDLALRRVLPFERRVEATGAKEE
jgi:cytochrome c peroxidase